MNNDPQQPDSHLPDEPGGESQKSRGPNSDAERDAAFATSAQAPANPTIDDGKQQQPNPNPKTQSTAKPVPSEPKSQNGSSESPDETSKHTAVRCLALVARHHGLEASAERLVHDYSLEHEEPTLRRLLRMAQDLSLKAKHVRLNWKHLEKIQQAFPVIVRLENGNFVIIVGMRRHENEDGKTETQVALFDPLADRADFIFLNRETFEKKWRGEAVLCKRARSLFDKEQPFSLKWFIPEVKRQWFPFVNVAIAAIVIQLIALVVPLYFQIVIDKVLVNNAMQTLHVITVGIIVALLFDALFNFLRSYLLLHATSKIDIRVSTRTFQHLLALPMNFFEQITAGVLTKHMQQTSKIREFLTGSLFLTILDSVSLFVFVPIMLMYSVSLTIIVLTFSGLLALNIGVLLGPYRRRLEALYEAEGNRQAMLVETIHGAQTVKALSMEPTQRKKWDQRSAESVGMHYRVGKISLTATTISKLLEKLMTVAIVWFGAKMVLDREISVGALIAFK
ncbi:MAG: ABC transporter transmembrane domain-containing protein [Pirellulaceae bacterium]